MAKQKEPTQSEAVLYFLKDNPTTTTDELNFALHLDSEIIGQVVTDLIDAGYALHVEDDGTVLFGIHNIIDIIEDQICEIEETLTYLNERSKAPVVITSSAPTRKDQVLALLQTGKHWTVPGLAKECGLEGDKGSRNISSQLSYLRKDGHRIATDSRGYKFLEV